MQVAYLLISLDDRGRKICDLLRSEAELRSAADGSIAAFVHQPSDEEISSSLRALLSGRPGPVRGLEVRLVGDLLADGTLARVSAFKESLPRLVSNLLRGFPWYIEIVVLVPHEEAAWSEEAKAFLTNHQAPLLWVVSPFNGRLFTTDELDALCARFLALDMTADLPPRLWDGGRPREGIASFGLSGLVVPAEEIVNRAAHRLAAEVLALMAGPGVAAPAPRAPSGEQWLSVRRLRFSDLTAAIGQDAHIPLGERERKVALEKGNERAWPDRLWSVFYFFGFEGLAHQNHRIAARRDETLAAALKVLDETADDLVERSSTPAAALRFLEELAQVAAAERGARMEIGGARSHLHAALEVLKETYTRLPASYVGLLLRVWAGGLAAAYPLHPLIPFLWSDIQGHLLVSFWGLWLLMGAAGSVAATLFYLDRHSDFVRAKLSAEGALWKALEYVVTARVHNSALDVLNTIVCTAASPMQREELRVACEGVPSTHDAVTAYAARLREASEAARQQANEPIVTAPFHQLPIGLPTAVASLRPEHLTDRLVAEGFHRGWRDADTAQLVEKAVALIAEVVRTSPMPTLVEAFPTGPDATALVRSLVEESRPLLALDTAGPSPRRLVFAHGAAGSAVAGPWRAVDPHSMWRVIEDPYQLVVLSVVHGLAADDLLARQRT